MTYKSRNPHIKYWPNSMLETFCAPFPFDEPAELRLFEIDAPDFSTQFLGTGFDANEKEDLFIGYLIEEPVDCPMRRKFEFGEITWLEFWYHHGWVIEYQVEFHIGGARVRYVHPSEMVKNNTFYFTQYNHLSPMLLKLRELEDRSSFDYHLGDDMEELAVRLAEFREKYPEIVQQNLEMLKAA